MKNRTLKFTFILIVATVALSAPILLLAQDEDTLAELVAVLTGRIQNVEERVEALELRHSPATMSIDPDTNFCNVVGLDGDSLLLQKETLLAYVEKFGDSPDYIVIGFVEMSSEGYVAVRWTLIVGLVAAPMFLKFGKLKTTNASLMGIVNGLMTN